MMGYVGAKIDLATVRKKMARARTYMRNLSYLTAKEKKFCADSEVFNWICRHYRYNYTEWNGNVENIYNETYEQYYDILLGSSYSYMMKLLKEGSDIVYPDSERRWLINQAKILRQRYK